MLSSHLPSWLLPLGKVNTDTVLFIVISYAFRNHTLHQHFQQSLKNQIFKFKTYSLKKKLKSLKNSNNLPKHLFFPQNNTN